MVNFEKLLDKSKITKPVDPEEIFKQLDKDSEKEYLRNAQKIVLEKWFNESRNSKDSIIKLPTGQGKTLLGLLILQSSLNEGKGPALYICPDSYLVDQTYEQAKSFGFNVIKSTETPLPRDFLNSESILIATCSKLFNGKSVFGVRGSTRYKTVNIGAIVVDDAHKCLDIIRETFSIKALKLKNKEDNPIYKELWTLFEDSLKEQAPGTFTDIQKERDCLMAVPHWIWYDKRNDVLEILAKYSREEEIEWAWNLIRDHIGESTCVFSGYSVEISPRLLPIDRFPSFVNAQRRIFLSATLFEDAFLVRDMDIDKKSVLKPIISNEKYSGERLILLPFLIDPYLTRSGVISWIKSLAQKYGNFGIVSIVPSRNHADAWKGESAVVTSVRNIDNTLSELKRDIGRGKASKVMVLVNAYDGVDLPQNTCRILTLDSLPKYNTLVDEYYQEMRPHSVKYRRKLAQRVEQGMGRAIRGSGDWCIVVIIGNNITNFLSEKAKRAYLSPEAQMQIKIGEDLATEIQEEGGQLEVMETLIEQCINRNEKWKMYYNSEMLTIVLKDPSQQYLDQVLIEREAELLYKNGMYNAACDKLQYNFSSLDQNDEGWYLQLMSTYLYPLDKAGSMDKQMKAHIENPSLFRPPVGIKFQKMVAVGNRVSRILDWIKERESYSSIILEISEILSDLNFGVPATKFETSLRELGKILGFISSRPEQMYGIGPDNLWKLGTNAYWVIECKNEVEVGRPSISKREIGQISNAIGWFDDNYQGEGRIPLFVHPTHIIASNAFPPEPLYVMRKQELQMLKENVRRFFNVLSSSTEINRLDQRVVSEKIYESALDTKNFQMNYIIRAEKET